MDSPNLTDSINKLIKKYAIARGEATEVQLVDLIKQILLSGDITIASVPGKEDKLIYVPYEEANRLRLKVQELLADKNYEGFN